ncbi:8098_t:CDS:2 [Diversispora eburnea]|uniref:8098_t:CDS:1 n=1 Tax=Diversispora eburnea TaxID=1213867 RepID=A0A9N9CN15_9GLOM|nr:8098_t:CDS:2 [Diversispora eburnea]
MSSSYDIGDNFECLVLSRPRHSLNPNFSRPSYAAWPENNLQRTGSASWPHGRLSLALFNRPMPGDRGKDITGTYHGFSVVIPSPNSFGGVRDFASVPCWAGGNYKPADFGGSKNELGKGLGFGREN